MVFKPNKKNNKVALNITISVQNMAVIEQVMKNFDVGISKATEEILNYFRDEWDKGTVPKTLEELDKIEKEEEEAKKK